MKRNVSDQRATPTDGRPNPMAYRCSTTSSSGAAAVSIVAAAIAVLIRTNTLTRCDEQNPHSCNCFELILATVNIESSLLPLGERGSVGVAPFGVELSKEVEHEVDAGGSEVSSAHGEHLGGHADQLLVEVGDDR